ncbi:hypothetical protein COCSADRAFT_175267 [Bipolaris sorokiniana ND90Pr]|uniref:Uncharacterized protein n=1 Tax=Cochliobolus sativus (strain ND90Pr / ATCC 201652) TaxID=665912 RepID=M2SCI1_COCSN|nr:uncharacterized protein COCSADRAFT_175267 [Bipolaris sorokiniana ND90Pr]EMD60175.1 hypothetical protein COCSADRAFT_175267 [Bipolaris sorokiniana ND90Pr]
MEKLRGAETAATQRLRKTFKYPSESDDEDAVEAGMDGQDRATLLQTLSAHDTSTTHKYTLFLLVLPLLPILLYIPRLFSLSTFLPSLAAIASFLASAYTLYFLPLPPTKGTPIDDARKTKNAAGKSKSRIGIYDKTPSWEKTAEKSVRRPVPYISESTADAIAANIMTVNRAVCGILALSEVWMERDWSQGFMVGGGFLPGLICFVVLWARTELRIIDMDALEELNNKAAGQSKAK